MKKVHLTDGLPTDIRQEDESEEVNRLAEVIISKCENSGLSYVEVNKALYLADKELYTKTLTKRPYDAPE